VLIIADRPLSRRELLFQSADQASSHAYELLDKLNVLALNSERNDPNDTEALAG
jgi:hypothetical protein